MNGIRNVICSALILYCAGLMVLALWPSDGRSPVTVICAVLAGISALLLLAHMWDALKLPGEEYAYLLTGMVGATIFGIYVIHTNDTSWEQARLGLLIASGSVTGYGSFLAQGWEKHREREQRG